MKKGILAVCGIALVFALSGCGAINSLIIHPIKKLHSDHESYERERAAEAKADPND